MTRTKSQNPKIHITATIDPINKTDMTAFDNDDRNRIDGNKPGVSWIVNAALHKFFGRNVPAANQKK